MALVSFFLLDEAKEIEPLIITDFSNLEPKTGMGPFPIQYQQ